MKATRKAGMPTSHAADTDHVTNPAQATDRGSQVKVSIVVPTHNTGETVLTGLRSFLGQTMPDSDYEVLYVDDGSTDDTVAVLEAELARQGRAEPAVRILRIENSGWPGRPRNTGTDAARGEFVHYVDDDDWLAPEALERTYARAQETGADIVIGRMAGHGRNAPRVLFEKPVTAADLRKDTALLASMTVHKLFRRAFLREHGLRFPEGAMRLEDHMFTLRAFLLTGRVATVHDYTCYHWVRHPGEQHNISYATIDPGPYVDSIREVLALMDAPDTYVAPGRHRYRLAANWYGKKALARLTGNGFLQQPEQRRAEWVRAVGALAAEMPAKADAALPTRLRIVAALARHGDRALLEQFAKLDAGVDHRPRVDSSAWREGKLTVRCSTRLVHREGRHTRAAPLVLAGEQGGYHLQLSPELTAVPGVAAAADVTRAVQRRNVRCQLVHREGGTVLNVSTDHSVTEAPVPGGSAGEGAGAKMARWLRIPARSASRLPGPGRKSGGSRAPRFEAEFTVDPARADHGKPLAAGTWELQLQLGCGGWRTARTLSGLSIDVPEQGPPAQPAPGDGAAVTQARRTGRPPVPGPA